jgi:DNA processing protein
MAEDSRLLDWLVLSLIPGLGPVGMRSLIERFGGPSQVLTAPRQELEKVAGLRRQVVDAICRPPIYTDAERELRQCEKAGISILSWENPAYPAILRNISDPPLLLYASGDLGSLGQPGIGVVGARAATTYGQQVARSLSCQLARRGMVIISGFALGIDTAAHWGAIDAGGRTIAVLGCGLDIVYPEQNRNLFDKILETGTLISEYPLGTKPDGFRFPARNRIISGLAHGVLVVEAARRSGSLITARMALDQGREVFAVPGRVDSWKSEGTHRLLQEGAKLVYKADDIFEELFPEAKIGFGIRGGNVIPAAPTNAVENELLSLLDVYPRTIDEIIQAAGWPAGKVNEMLLMLELKQCIEALPGKQYRRKVMPPS